MLSRPGEIVRQHDPDRFLTALFAPPERRDTVFVPFHWGGAACVNALTSDALDPTSRMPEFKTCPVAVEKAAFTPDEHNGAVVGPAVART